MKRIRFVIPKQARLTALAVAVTLLSLVAGRSTSIHAAADHGHLLVADTVAEKLYVYSIPGMALTGQIDNVKVGSHFGAGALPDGRILIVDDKNVEFVALRIDATGRPVVAGRAAIPTTEPWNRAAWGAVDPSFRYAAFTSDGDTGAQTLSIVDLTDYHLGQVEIALQKNRNGVYEEMLVYLAGNPLHAFVTVGEEVRDYAVADVMKGQVGEPVSRTSIPPNSHGPAIAQGQQRLYSATADGLAVVDLHGAQLSASRVIPWSSGGITAGQNFRPRLSFDGNFVYGALTAAPTPALAPSDWASQQNYIHIADLQNETGRLLPLARGIVGRFSLSAPYALFWNVHPDGDFAYLFDVDPSSASFQQITAKIPLARLGNAPVAGMPASAGEARVGTISPDGRWAFVSHGGDGKVSVIDTLAQGITAVISLPTPLKGGGYLVAVQPGAPLLDTNTR